MSLPDGVIGVSYSATLVAVNGRPPYTWALASGSGPLPSGLALNASTGEITGTPTTVGSSDFTIRVTDSGGGTETKAFTVEIGDAVPLVSRVSLANDGSQANSDSGSPVVSDTGRFVAFTSFATNLVAADTNTVTDIFLRDRTCNLTLRVSVASDGTQANGQSFAPAISALTSGTLFVAYVSEATNLVSNDTNNQADVFVTAINVSGCTLSVASTVRASVGIRLPNQVADIFTVTTIGHSALQMVANVFVGGLAEIVAGFGAGQVRRITANDATTLTVDSDWSPVPDNTSVFRVRVESINANSLPSLSADGRFVAYHSTSGNLVDADTNFSFDAFLTELQFASGSLSVVTARRVSTFKRSLAVRLAVNLPTTPADIFSANTIGNTTLAMVPDEHVGRVVQIVSGTGEGQTREITTNDATTLTVDIDWDPEPDATSMFRVVTGRIAADIFIETAIGNSTLTMMDNEHVNREIEILSGTGAGQTRQIIANNPTTFVVTPAWNTVPDTTSIFRVITSADQAAGFVTDQAIGNFDLLMTVNDHVGQVVEIVAGTGMGQARTVALNGSSTLSFVTGWAILPDATSIFRVSRQASAANRVRLSPDGAFAAFSPDVFLHERASGIATQQTFDPTGGLPNGPSLISALDARADQVLFQSGASNLVTGDTNSASDLFLRDRSTSTTERVSVGPAGEEADGSTEANAGLSGGGNLVAFASRATNLASNDRNGNFDIFLRDRPGGTTTRISLAMGGVNPNGASFDPSMSLDGTTIVFASEASTMVPGDTNGARDIFVASTGLTDPPVPPLSLITSSLPTPRKGIAYAVPLRAVGGVEPLFWAAEGALPPGLFLDPRTGMISGVPQKAGRFHFTVVVMDADRPTRTARRTFTLVVEP